MTHYIEEYIEQVTAMTSRLRVPNSRYAGANGFLLQHGQKFPLGKTPDTLPNALLNKACFENCYRIALKFPRYAYAEGYAIPVIKGESLFPMEHAWLVDRATGEAIEITWEELGTEYFGVLITKPALREAHRQNHCFSVLFAWTERHFRSLMMGAIPTEEVLDFLEVA